MAFNVYQADNTKLGKNITVPTSQGQVDYQLVGVIYYGGHHFTCRIITPDGHIWMNDGRTMGGKCEYDGKVKVSEIDRLKSLGSRNMTVAVYLRVL
ncbi:hypothetical protein FOMPIDRAFT_1137118 [Fomitopsis schrenkii]|uniref:USP domain-containing protein n=1 Tax=Fomitopsis schrenkii TaxID=2126942 RepID=S8ET71_FOMSC|nr:hypothetical protein FOMPIDRAFT_1137118 [Fomitopsis schrenkii]